MGNSFSAATDGKDHINIYSKAKTSLGLFLSNFAHSPVTTPDGRFASIEGYWYWLNLNHPDRDKLRNLHGFEAKRVGRELQAKDWNDSPGFKDKIKKAIYAKIFSNIPMAIELKKSTLPFTHYYDYKGHVVEPENGKWVIEFIEGVRSRLQLHEGLIYQQGDLFEAPPGSVIAHSCNTQGAWGKGIALEFKQRFPLAYQEQNRVCQKQGPHLLGGMWITEENNYKIVSLFTSDGYGRRVSAQEKVLKNTSQALSKLLNCPDVNEIWIPKINSGLFGTPWEHTEIVILGLLILKPGKKIIVRTGLIDKK